MKKPYTRPIIRKQYMGLSNKFGGYTIPEPIPAIDGVDVNSLLKEFGSPLFVFSEKTLRRKVQDLNQAFSSRYPNFQLAWSYKTNYLNAICKVFHDEGSWAEVVSGFEYEKAQRNNIPGNRIIFNGPYKPYAVLKRAVENGSKIHIDHLDELQDLLKISEELNRKIDVAIRLNMDTGMYPSWDRFGFNLESGQAFEAASRIAASNGKLQLTGLHAHIGTFMLDTAPYKKQVKKMAEFWHRCKQELNQPLSYIDLGGGFASHNKLKSQYLSGNSIIPDFDTYAQAITSALFEAFAPEEPPMLFLETGRALVDDAGYLLTSVMANKTMPNGKRAILVDAGINLLFTTTWYDLNVSPTRNHTGTWEEMGLFGPMCMNIDKIREKVLLPNLQRNESLVIHPVGAYNVTQWMQFIEMRPAVVMIDMDNKARLIRRKETIDDLHACEV